MDVEKEDGYNIGASGWDRRIVTLAQGLVLRGSGEGKAQVSFS